MQFKLLPKRGDIGHFEVVDGELLLIGKPHIGVLQARRPFDVIDAVDVLQESNDAFKPIGNFSRNQFADRSRRTAEST